MKHVLCVHLKWWPIDRLRRRRPALRGKPLVLIQTSGNKRTIVHVSPETPAGIWPGMTLASARARHAELIDLPVTPEADLKSLEALGHWLMRFSPFVAVAPPCSFFLDATGMERLVGSLSEVRRRVAEGLAGLRLHAGVAIAPTPGAAWALAAFGKGEPLLHPLPSGEGWGEGELRMTPNTLPSPGIPGEASGLGDCPRAGRERVSSNQSKSLVIPPHSNPLGGSRQFPSLLPRGEGINAVVQELERIPDALVSLPSDALRLDPTTSLLLAELGVRTAGELLALPRDELRVRFGVEILNRIDQALGSLHEPLELLPPRVPIDAMLEFDGAVESLEAVALAVRELVRQVVAQLATCGLGARELKLGFRPPYAPAIEKTIRLVRPSRNESAIFKLLGCALETLEAEEGFVAIGLAVTAFQRLDDDQAALIGGEEARDLAEVDHLVERLRARVDRAVEWGELVESNLPESAFRFHDADRGGGVALVPRTGAVNIFRPLRLLREPREIGVIVRPSESREGEPVSFTDQAQEVHRLVHVRGPERITGQWWQGRWKVRDYFDVLDNGGQRYWVFRVAQTGRWFLHGIFE